MPKENQKTVCELEKSIIKPKNYKFGVSWIPFKLIGFSIFALAGFFSKVVLFQACGVIFSKLILVWFKREEEIQFLKILYSVVLGAFYGVRFKKSKDLSEIEDGEGIISLLDQLIFNALYPKKTFSLLGPTKAVLNSSKLECLFILVIAVSSLEVQRVKKSDKIPFCLNRFNHISLILIHFYVYKFGYVNLDFTLTSVLTFKVLLFNILILTCWAFILRALLTLRLKTKRFFSFKVDVLDSIKLVSLNLFCLALVGRLKGVNQLNSLRKILSFKIFFASFALSGLLLLTHKLNKQASTFFSSYLSYISEVSTTIGSTHLKVIGAHASWGTLITAPSFFAALTEILLNLTLFYQVYLSLLVLYALLNYVKLYAFKVSTVKGTE